MRYAHIVGWGSYLPEQILTNHDLAQMVDTTDEWILSRTGIRERRLAGEKENVTTMAFQAAARALAVADMHPAQLDMIIVATSTAEHVFPSTASLVQDALGATRAGAFDLSAACSGFVYALSLAANAIKSGAIDTAVVIGAEALSRVVDWQDRATCILFGDGAGALVLKGSEVPGGVLASTLRSDGSGGDLLSLHNTQISSVPFIGTSYVNGHGPYIHMNGRQVFRFATSVVADAIEEVMKKANLQLADISLVVPHQANLRIIDHVAKKLKLPPEKFYLNLERYGNTSAASIPIALCEAVQEGRLRPDDTLVFVGFGGGLTWGATVVKWDVTPPKASAVKQRLRQARYVAMRIRSRARRLLRRFMAWVGGSPTPEARLKDADRRPEEEGDRE